jgi:signal peptidase II
MYFKKARVIIFISGLFLLADRWLKYQALHAWSHPRLLNHYFGWQPFFNKGIAFSLSIPSQITVIFSLPIIILVLYLLLHEWKKESTNLKLIMAWSLIIGGAISNFIDRLIYKQVIDYFTIGTAVINISDIMIVVGLILYLLTFKHLGNNCHSEQSEQSLSK